MEQRPLGRTDVTVSAVGLGIMTFGSQTAEPDAFDQLDLATEAGITLFDVAENYPSPGDAETQGRSEEILGRWLQKRRARDRSVVATKVTGPNGWPHLRGENRRLDRDNIRAAVEGSLRRLGVDHIDLYQVHWPDRLNSTFTRARFRPLVDPAEVVPLEDTLGFMGELVDDGKVRHVGVANETPWGVMRYLEAATQRGLPRMASIQNGYSLLKRQFETGLAEIAIQEAVGLIAYSPLGRGQLTGKWLPEEPRADARVDSAVRAYVDIAQRHGLSPATMALAFVRQQPFVTSVLMAASRVQQLEQNLESLDVTLSRDIVKEIDAVHDSDPNPGW